ncbi:hypothetical protein MXB_4217, partial [Myxobolus squamalis]
GVFFALNTTYYLFHIKLSLHINHVNTTKPQFVNVIVRIIIFAVSLMCTIGLISTYITQKVTKSNLSNFNDTMIVPAWALVLLNLQIKDAFCDIECIRMVLFCNPPNILWIVLMAFY